MKRCITALPATVQRAIKREAMERSRRVYDAERDALAGIVLDAVDAGVEPDLALSTAIAKRRRSSAEDEA